MRKAFWILFSLVLFSCGTKTPQASPRLVSVYSTFAAQPWLTKLYACADGKSIALNFTAQDPEIFLRVGEPQTLFLPAYQIATEELLIVTHRESPVQNLTLEQAQALFAGQGDSSAQMWVYASDDDVQVAFDQLVMKGRSVFSFARLAVNPQEMSDVLNAESNSVGILPRHWKMGNTREVYSAGVVPVLAITREEPQGAVTGLISCLQSN